jgi:hypothetical protein
MDDGGGAEGPGRDRLGVRTHGEDRACGILTFVGDAVERDELQRLAVELRNPADIGLAQPPDTLPDGVEHRLDVQGRLADDAQNLADRRLALESLRQAFLKIANRRGSVLPQLGRNREPGGLSLRGLRTPTHRPLLHRAMVGARLRQGVRGGKYEWPVFDDSGERASVLDELIQISMGCIGGLGRPIVTARVGRRGRP